jgi:hypothetical protein
MTTITIEKPIAENSPHRAVAPTNAYKTPMSKREKQLQLARAIEHIVKLYPREREMNRAELVAAIKALWADFSSQEIQRGLGRGLTRSTVMGIINRSELANTKRANHNQTTTITPTRARLDAEATTRRAPQAPSSPPRPQL